MPGTRFIDTPKNRVEVRTATDQHRADDRLVQRRSRESGRVRGHDASSPRRRLWE
jgi:hypothetical protein